MITLINILSLRLNTKIALNSYKEKVFHNLSLFHFFMFGNIKNHDFCLNDFNAQIVKEKKQLDFSVKRQF